MSQTVPADLGGLPGFGPVIVEPDEPLFHGDWEARVLAFTLAMGATGSWSIDQSRAAREVLPAYRSLSYYQIWFHGLVSLMLERGLVAPDEVASGSLMQPAAAVTRVLRQRDVAAVLARGAPTARKTDALPLFRTGDRVRTVSSPPGSGHSRLPSYARGAIGTVRLWHGAHVYPDASGAGAGEVPEHLYTVEFAASQLFPDAGSHRVSIDAFEPYLERA